MEEPNQKMSFYTSIMASLGFYFLIFIGLINHVIFTPKVASEKNREVKTNLFTYIIFNKKYIFRDIHPYTINLIVYF